MVARGTLLRRAHRAANELWGKPGVGVCPTCVETRRLEQSYVGADPCGYDLTGRDYVQECHKCNQARMSPEAKARQSARGFTDDERAQGGRTRALTGGTEDLARARTLEHQSTAGRLGAAAGSRKALCQRWNINRGLSCTCGRHEEKT